MDRIDFNMFFMSVKDNISDIFLPFINPYAQTFWKSKNVFYALTFGDDWVYINYMNGTDANNIEGLRGLIKSLKGTSIKTLKFGTFEGNSHILTFYRYIGAKSTNVIPNYYKDGKALLEYELDWTESYRLKSI